MCQSIQGGEEKSDGMVGTAGEFDFKVGILVQEATGGGRAVEHGESEWCFEV